MTVFVDPRLAFDRFRTGFEINDSDDLLQVTVLSQRSLKEASTAFLASAFVSSGLASPRSEEHTSELQSLMRISYAVFCLKKKKKTKCNTDRINNHTTSL